MRLVWTRHVPDRLAERGLERAWVERVALAPEWIEPDPRPGVARHLGADGRGHVLRVAVADGRGERRVLSAHLDRGAAKRRP